MNNNELVRKSEHPKLGWTEANTMIHFFFATTENNVHKTKQLPHTANLSENTDKPTRASQNIVIASSAILAAALMALSAWAIALHLVMD